MLSPESATSTGALPVTVSGLTLIGIQLQDWVYILTIIYLLALLVGLTYKAIKKLWGK